MEEESDLEKLEEIDNLIDESTEIDDLEPEGPPTDELMNKEPMR